MTLEEAKAWYMKYEGSSFTIMDHMSPEQYTEFSNIATTEVRNGWQQEMIQEHLNKIAAGEETARHLHAIASKLDYYFDKKENRELLAHALNLLTKTDEPELVVNLIVDTRNVQPRNSLIMKAYDADELEMAKSLLWKAERLIREAVMEGKSTPYLQKLDGMCRRFHKELYGPWNMVNPYGVALRFHYKNPYLGYEMLLPSKPYPEDCFSSIYPEYIAQEHADICMKVNRVRFVFRGCRYDPRNLEYQRSILDCISGVEHILDNMIYLFADNWERKCGGAQVPVVSYKTDYERKMKLSGLSAVKYRGEYTTAGNGEPGRPLRFAAYCIMGSDGRPYFFGAYTGSDEQANRMMEDVLDAMVKTFKENPMPPGHSLTDPVDYME